MAATSSNTALPLGSRAPDFALRDVVTGETFARADLEGRRGLLVMFICNHCPYVIHVRDELARIAGEYGPRGVAVVAVSSNDPVAWPQDGPEAMRDLAVAEGWAFPYLFDADQSVARAYGAACTPDLYLFDASHRLVYHGQLDDSRPGSDVPVTGADLRTALEALLGGRPVPATQKPCMGCSIKWS